MVEQKAEQIAEHRAEAQAGPGMSASVPRGAVLAGALGVGIAGDLLLRSSSGPGLNLFVLFAVLAAALGVVSRRAALRPSREAVAWIAVGLLFALALVLRAAPALQALAFLAASSAFALPALRAGRPWLRRSGVGDHLEAIGGAVLHSGLGPLRFMVEGSRRGRGSAGEGEATEGALQLRSGRSGRRPWAILRGILFAMPLLFVFGALFMSADRVFAEIVTNLFGVLDLEELFARLALIGLLGWLASGYLSGFVTGTRVRSWLEPVAPRPAVGILEAGTALALVDLLFAAFVLVQLRYLFGGATLVEVTPGLTYAEYAREGFAQLVVAAGLVLPCLLAADWLLRREGPRDEWTFRLLGSVQLVLLVVVIASAFQRVRVYQAAYGLTELRFYGAAFLAWLTLLSVWFAATILRGRRDRFASVAAVSGFALVAALVILNPDARIAQANLARAGDVDVAYLATLSADAAPALIGALPELPTEARCALAQGLQRRWGPDGVRDWRSWNLAEARARRLVSQAGVAEPGGTPCPEPAP